MLHHIEFSNRILCIWDVPPATANRRFADIYLKFSISILDKSKGAVCRLPYPRRLFGAGARR
jgi:hypothetical protein